MESPQNGRNGGGDVGASQLPRDNGVARLLADFGLSTGRLEKLCFREHPDAPAGRETIRRYAEGKVPEGKWNEEVILAMALATGRRVADISETAHARLIRKRDRYLETPIFLVSSTDDAQLALAVSA